MKVRIRWSLFAVTVGFALIAVSSASGVDIDGYTAAGTPAHVRPSVQTTFAVTLTNKPSSSTEADKAKIAIPPAFTVAAASVQASVSAAGACVASTWVADGELIAGGKINLKRPGGGANSRLCPGATLTVQFLGTSPAAEGTYVWATELFRGGDTFVLTGPQPSVEVDGTSPTVTINSKPTNPSSDSSPSFAFSAGEPAGFECKLDDGSFAPCSSPKSYSGLLDGSHTFTVRATDLSGNAATSSYTWLIETTLPVVTLTNKPNLASKDSTASFSFTASKPATFQCKFDGAAFELCTSPASYSSLSDGPHTFRVKATGTAGTGPETVYAWTIDTAGPTTAITDKPADPTSSRSASFAFAASEPATFQCKLDDGAFAACSPPQAYGNLGDGRHVFVVRAIDALSNVGAETAYAWSIETRPPLATITSAPAALGNSAIASFSFTADEPATFQCKLDEGGFEACSSPASYAGLRDGGHAFVVRAIDSAGNTGVASRGWMVDATAPQTRIDSAPARSTRATSATFTFSAGETAAFQCRLDRGAFAPCVARKAYKALARSPHTFAVRAIDSAGNVDPTPAVFKWTIGRPPTRTVAKYALFAPAPGARVIRPPLLRWRSVSRASYYNVQLYRGGRKVLTAWPTRSRLALRTRWTYGGRVERFTAGVYRWYVWPGFGRASDRRYGRLLGSSAFVVGRATPHG